MSRTILILFLQISLAASGSGQHVVLNEIMFDPATSDRADEFVEILNISDSVWVDMHGWRLGDGSGTDQIIDSGQGLLLAPGQFAVILDGDYQQLSETYDAFIPADALVLTIDGSTLGSAGLSNSRCETVCLIDHNGYPVSIYTYSIGNTPGYSDEKIFPSGDNNIANWGDGTTPGGTPGSPNSLYRIEEVQKLVWEITPNPFSPNGDGFEDVSLITVSLPYSDTRLSISMHSLTGRQLFQFCSGQRVGYNVSYECFGYDQNGTYLPEGIYIVYIEVLSAAHGYMASDKKVMTLTR